MSAHFTNVTVTKIVRRDDFVRGMQLLEAKCQQRAASEI